MAFEDTSVAPLYERRQWGLKSEAVYKEIVSSGPRKLGDLMQALRGWRLVDTMRPAGRRHDEQRHGSTTPAAKARRTSII
jgi:hypothetical protein